MSDLLPVGLSDVERRLDIATIELSELQSRFTPLKVTEHAILMTDNVVDSPPRSSASLLREYGSTGQSIFGGVVREDYNAELRGRQGLELYNRMRKSDGQIRGALRLVKTPVIAARWYIEPASPRMKDQTIAKYVWDNLQKWMSVSWPQTLSECLAMLDFGYYVFEKVFDVRGGKIIWKKFAPRHPLDIREWVWDAHGGPKGVWLHQDMGASPDVFIPIWKLAIFTFDKEAGNLEGVSVLRAAYQHWFFKQNLYKIDGIQKERHGIGIPVIKMPPNFDSNDSTLADEIGRQLRTNEKAYIKLPPGWEIFMLKLEGNAVNALESADHHNKMIANSILAPFLGGEATINEHSQEIFFRSIRFVADIIRDVFNKFCIPQLVNWNWAGVDEYPELRVRHIGDTVDWRTISFAMRNFAGAGILIPDDPLELWVRDEMNLPKPDTATRRVIVVPENTDAQEEMNIPDPAAAVDPAADPQASADTGRQSKAGDMKQTAQGTGKSNSGQDNSGGKK